MKKAIKNISMIFLGVFFLGIPHALHAQTIVPGVRLGAYTDAGDIFVGGELLVPVIDQVYFNPNIEYVFIENGSYVTFNGDFHYDFYLEDSPVFLWAGAGLGILYWSPEGRGNSHTDAGFNLLFGAGLPTDTRLTPYAQAKIIISDNTEFVLGLGIRF